VWFIVLSLLVMSCMALLLKGVRKASLKPGARYYGRGVIVAYDS
jgi:hypothetical protein